MFKRLFVVGILFASVTAGAAGNEWVEQMAKTYITDQVNESDRLGILQTLGYTPVESQEWVEQMAAIYITDQVDGSDRSKILQTLGYTPVESQEWVKQMAAIYITDQVDGSDRARILSMLGYTPVRSQEWIERMAAIYITDQVNGPDRARIVSVLANNAVRSEGREWMGQMMNFLGNPGDNFEEAWPIILQLCQLTSNLPTLDLLEQARVRLVAGVNQAREEWRLLQDFLRPLVTRVRDELTQQQRMNPNAARPRGRAYEIHFASVLNVPLEEGHIVPLYKAVESQLHSLGIGNDMTLVKEVSTVQGWVEAYAESAQKSRYHQVVTKGYGNGSNPSYNQEITPLLRFVVPYMNTLAPEVQSAWILPALQESATAYDGGDAISCAKGIQERVGVVGFDVEGIDPALRSLSKLARDYLYITDPLTGGADTWIKDVVQHLMPAERVCLLEAEKPDQEAFNNMFQRALSGGLHQSGLTPLHTEVLLKNAHIQGRFKDSLAMHYEYEEHYGNLQAKVREMQTPEERRNLLVAAAERRLPKAEQSFEDMIGRGA